MKPDREYLGRVIAAVRLARHVPTGWPQLANLLADEVERLWNREERTRRGLLDVKRYAVFHGAVIGECVAWAALKEDYGVDAAFRESEREGG